MRTPPKRRGPSSLASSLLLTLGLACGGDGGSTQPGEPASINISPETPTVAQLGQVQLTAKAVDARGVEVPDQAITFTSRDPDLLWVSPTGMVTSLGPAGTSTVEAASGSLQSSVSVTITQTPTSVDVRAPVMVLSGSSRQLPTAVLDAVGSPIPGSQATYSTTAPEISITTSGLVSALGPRGRFVATASLGTVQQTIEIVVPTHPAGIITATQNLSLTPWGVAISPQGIGYVTISASGAPSLLRAELPALVLTQGPSGASGGDPLAVAFRSDGAFAYVPALFPGALAIVDPERDEVVDKILGLPVNAYGVAVASNDSAIYVSADDDLLYVVDLSQRRVATTVDLHAVSNQLILDPTRGHVLASSYNGAKVVEVDEASRAIVRNLPIGGQPQGVAVSPDGTELYVADELGRLVVWDLVANVLKDEVPLPAGAFGLALTPDAEQVYVTIAGGPNGVVRIYDRVSRDSVTTLETGGSPRRIAFDITGGTAIITNDGSRVHFVQ